MSRFVPNATSSRSRHRSAEPAECPNPIHAAEDIALVAFGLARQARAAGLTTLGQQLETIAREAGAEAAARRWPNATLGR